MQSDRHKYINKSERISHSLLIKKLRKTKKKTFILILTFQTQPKTLLKIVWEEEYIEKGWAMRTNMNTHARVNSRTHESRRKAHRKKAHRGKAHRRKSYPKIAQRKKSHRRKAHRKKKLSAKMTKAEGSSPRNLRCRRKAQLILTATQSLYVKTQEFCRRTKSKLNCQSCESRKCEKMHDTLKNSFFPRHQA